jgi:hypothetical protein
LPEGKWVFLRDNRINAPSPKYSAWQLFKEGKRRQTNLFDDLVLIRLKLISAANRLNEIVASAGDGKFEDATLEPIAQRHPALDPYAAEESAGALREEAALIVEFWRLRISQGSTFRLAPKFVAIYTPEQVRWVPPWQSMDDIPEDWKPFMDNVARNKLHIDNAFEEYMNKQRSMRGSDDPDDADGDDLELVDIEGDDPKS